MVKKYIDVNNHSTTRFISKLVIITMLVLLTPFTIVAVFQHGLLGIFIKVFNNSATMQVFIDLIIASFLILFWMWSDAKRTSRIFWPWALLTITAGSFGPLLYLLFRSSKN